MKILAIGIHPDDVELGCGGTVILAAEQRHDVVIVDLSDGTSSSNGTPDERAAEAAEAARFMGVGKRRNLGFPDTGIHSENTDQVRNVVRCIREETPGIVLVPSADDPHPDHASGGRLIERALYFAGVRGYDRDTDPWRAEHVLVYPGRNDFEPDIVVDVSTTHIKKTEAILIHRSQFVLDGDRTPTPLNSPGFVGFIEARGRIHGRRIGAEFGEPFLTTKPLAVSDFSLFGAKDL
jgi:bacillithiol biosynthesis deacetylase BshB1